MEKVRFKGEPYCPLCGTVGECARKKENKLVGRWNCYACGSSFNVLSKTMFQKTRIPLPKWFAAIVLMLNAKKSISSYQLGRDIGVLPMTAFRMQRKIRQQMQTSEGSQLLKGIVEVDETHVGGGPRGHRRWRERWESTKVPVLGFVERAGRVVMVIIDYPNADNIVPLVNQQVKANSRLMTDQAYHYRQVKESLKHESVNHGITYVRGEVHTNTIEGVWSLLKRAFNGTHHHYSKKWMPLYLAEAAYKYNVRKIKDTWGQFMRKVFRYLLHWPGYT